MAPLISSITLDHEAPCWSSLGSPLATDAIGAPDGPQCTLEFHAPDVCLYYVEVSSSTRRACSATANMSQECCSSDSSTSRDTVRGANGSRVRTRDGGLQWQHRFVRPRPLLGLRDGDSLAIAVDAISAIPLAGGRTLVTLTFVRASLDCRFKYPMLTTRLSVHGNQNLDDVGQQVDAEILGLRGSTRTCPFLRFLAMRRVRFRGASDFLQFRALNLSGDATGPIRFDFDETASSASLTSSLSRRTLPSEC